MARTITQEEVLASRDSLPAFPRVIEEILSTLDDPDANLNLLVSHVGRDPVMSARVFSLASAVGGRTRANTAVKDLYTATSLIGLSKLRQTAITTSLAGFLRGNLPPGLSPGFWEHSAAAGVSAQQVAAFCHKPTDPALIAGLLHDVGQLWLYRFEPQEFMAAWKASVARESTIDAAERARFGVDHTVIGAWLAESWGLPRPVCEAIRWHHAPDSALNDPLVAVVHIAEVLSNALDVSGGEATRVTHISAKACEMLGIKWDESADALFGRIDAVSHFLAHYFRPGEGGNG